MKPWEIDDLRRAMKARFAARGTRQFRGKVSTDSRTAADGELFFALVGERHDAHQYVADVIARCVAAVVVHAEQPADVCAAAQAKGVSILRVDNTTAALNRLAAAYRNELRTRVIVVGGSNGKTTTKRILHALLCEKFGPAGGVASPKSFNNNIGMPLTLLDVEPGHEFVILEIGTNAPGEIAALGAVARPDIAVITSVGLEHLEKLGDLAGVAREEAAIAAYLQPKATLVLPADAPELRAALGNPAAQKILVGLEGTTADLVGTHIVESLSGVRFAINGRGAYELPLLGAHNVSNALMAIAVARRLGATDEQIRAGLRRTKGAPMRLEPMRIGEYAIINDAYNANPSSMEAALQTFARIVQQGRPGTPGMRSVAILGDMLELGAASDAMHRRVGALVAQHQIDILMAIGAQMAQAAAACRAAGGVVYHFASTAEARAGMAGLLRPGDAILLKGSRGMALEKILEALGQAPALAH